jgi:hypothetical protein
MGVPQKTDFVVALSALNVPEPVVQPPPAEDTQAADDLWVKLCVLPCAAAGGRGHAVVCISYRRPMRSPPSGVMNAGAAVGWWMRRG